MPEHEDKTDEELVESFPPRDGSANDPVASAETHLDDVNMDQQREALKQIQKDIPSGGESVPAKAGE